MANSFCRHRISLLLHCIVGSDTLTMWPQHCTLWLDIADCLTHSLLLQTGTYGDPGRDPRGWTVTVAYAAVAPSTELGVKAAVSAGFSGHRLAREEQQ